MINNLILNSQYVVPPIVKNISNYQPPILPPIISSNKVKYKYIDPDGRRLAAGGILFYQKTNQGKGIWLIEEEDDKKNIVYSDFGGKYDYNDGDIIATIAREFREETYNMNEISYKDLKNLDETNHFYIDGYDASPTYLCIVIPIEFFNIQFDVDAIKEARERIIRANNSVPSEWYKTLDVKFLLLKDLPYYKLNNRTFAVLKSLMRNPKNNEVKEFFKDLKL
jgi:hypothetical protein